MIRSWLQSLARKAWKGRGLRNASRPASRLRARPGFDRLEDRTTASATLFEPPALIANVPEPPAPMPALTADAPTFHQPDYGHLPVAAPDQPHDSGQNEPVPDVSDPDVWGPDAPALDPMVDDAGASDSVTASSGSSGVTFADRMQHPRAPRVRREEAAAKGGRDAAPAVQVFSAGDPVHSRASPSKLESTSGQPDSLADHRITTGNAAKSAADGQEPPNKHLERTAPRGDAAHQFRPGAHTAPPLNAAALANETVLHGATEAHGPTVTTANVALAGLAPANDLPDGSLLRRYAVHREEPAFAALVQRHERLVLGVCQRVLGDSHAALDAFQATFLVLARKASTLDQNGSVAGWLYKVAYHLALRLRAIAARQRRREKQAAHDRPAATGAVTDTNAVDIENEEVRAALSEELQRLPDKYRVPLVLCYLDGRTHEEAAQAIGMPRGSMAKRIGEGLERLRERLSDRGF
jgi:RNA polymerase sigma factor (sigma-70 family)